MVDDMIMPAPPLYQGVGASQIVLPVGKFSSVYAFLCEHFSHISAEIWRQRIQKGHVLSAAAQPIDLGHPYQIGAVIYYYRELEYEQPIPFKADIVYEDDYLLVADKPHFLPVIPSGQFVHHTLLTQLKLATGLSELVPVHRIDRDTAGLVLFCKHKCDRMAYTQLFAQSYIRKQYEAIASTVGLLQDHQQVHVRMMNGEPFYRMQVVSGEPNSHTEIRYIEPLAHLDNGNDSWGRFILEPITGKQHQLRVHMASLNMPILHDALYPDDMQRSRYDFTKPLQLLAKTLSFKDPCSGRDHHFISCHRLAEG